jgi:hypothetical protein
MAHQSIITPDMGEKVLKVLGSYARLPSHGFVAGQAVASAIDEVLGKAAPVYNDIDVFLDFDRWGEHWPEDIEQHKQRIAEQQYGYHVAAVDNRRFANRVQFVDLPELHSDGYERKLSVAQRDLYSIGQTRTEGVVNFVRVDWSDSVRSETVVFDAESAELARRQMHWLTKVFDMNSTQAAVDLRTGQLFATPHFERYVRSRQLQIVTGFTPVHSLLRYLKKLDELAVYGNTDMHLRMVRTLVERAQGTDVLAQTRRRVFREGRIGMRSEDIQAECERRKCDNDYYGWWSRVGSGTRGEPLSFGRKYYEQYVKHQKLLNAHFMLTRHPRKDLWLLTSKTADERGEHFMRETPMLAALSFAEQSLQPSKVAQARRDGLEALAAAFPEEEYLVSSLRFACANGGPDYSVGMEDANLRKLWLDVMTEHMEFFWPIIGLTFMKQIALIRKMRAAFKKLGIAQPWGTLMRSNSGYASRLLEDEAVWKEFLDEHIGTLEPLCKPLPLPANMAGVAVRELISSRALIDEGLSQHHCVGGYSQWVESGDTRIVAFSTGSASQDRSTAEWHISVRHATVPEGQMAPVAEIRFEMRQHRGPFNRKPLENLAQAEEELRARMNQWAKDHLDDAIACVGAVPKEQKAFSILEDDGDIPF